jgi:hypothetical protein
VSVVELQRFLDCPTNQRFLKVIPESYEPDIQAIHEYIKQAGHIPDGIDKIEILNLSGMIIYSDTVNGNTYFSTQLTQLIPGLYLVQLSGKGISILKKLIVN